MAIGKYRNLKILVVTFLFLIISILTVSHEAYPRNWDWDQNHDCVEGEGGISGWGRWGYDGKMHGEFETKECCELLCKICPVYANTGRLQKTFTDLTIPGSGPALTIIRTYNSQDWASSLLGYGWTFNFGRRLIIGRNNDGEKLIGVLLETGEKNFYKEHPDGTLERLTDYGATYDLIKNGDNTYTIVNLDGTRYELREDGKIAKIVDRNQNELVFTYNTVGCLSRITNASGNYVDFQLGPNGKIASISDNLGRTITYAYDENGNLISATDPMGNTSQYVYNSNNLLAQIIDATGNTVESAGYDNNEPPRVSTFTEKGETYTIAYYSDRTEKGDSAGNTWTYYFNDVGVITKVFDPLGNVKEQLPNKITATSLDWEDDLNANRTTYTYDADGNMASRTDPLGNTTTYTYVTGTNWVETETDPLGHVTLYEYDAYGNQTKVIRDYGGPLENETSYTYDGWGNQTSVTDPLGNTTTYEYDAAGNLIKVTDPLGNVTTYTYDDRGNRLAETDALGNTTTYAYDLLDRLVSVTDVLGNTTAYAYDANGNRTSETDANGNTRTFSYDVYNRLIQETDPLGNTTSYSYDSRDNCTSMTDANGNTTSYAYDILDHITRQTNALGGQTNYTYDAAGNILTITDPNGNTTTFTYDANNRKISETNAAGETTSYSYDANGNLITQTHPYSNTIKRTYDSLSRLVRVADTLDLIRSYTYNLAGLLLTESDALGNTISYSYDANNRLIQRTDALGNNNSYSYNVVGNLLTITDREGNTTNYSYDALRRRISLTGQLGNTTTFTYNKVGNLLSISNANGNATSYSYDNANRLIQETYADGETVQYTYDGVGNRLTRIDQNGNTANYAYDALNRLTLRDYPGSNDDSFSYDPGSRMVAVDNAVSSVRYSYDAINRVTQERQNGKFISYAHDTATRTRQITYPGGWVITETRDKRERLATVTEGANTIASYSYTGDRLTTINYLNGTTATYSYYNANNWITSLSHYYGATQIAEFDYGFDKEGNRKYVDRLHDSSNSEQYIYDNIYRLTDFRQGTLDANKEISVPVTQTAYNLDGVGNWDSKTKDAVTETRTHNVVNEITDIDGTSLSYDDNGNLTDDGSNTYEYDYENRLIRVTRKSDSQVLAEFKYDALGRRVEKNDVVNGIITKYYLDGARVIEEQESGSTTAIYVYGDGIDELLQMQKGGATYYYHPNSLGSIDALTESSGNVVEYYRYDAYGEVSVYDGGWVYQGSSSIVDNPYLFTGRRLDDETSLYYYRARYYSPSLGRFVQRDTLGYVDGMNLYEFVKGNPINWIDPMGKWTQKGVLTLLCCCDKKTVANVKNLLVFIVDKLIDHMKKYEKKPDGTRGAFIEEVVQELNGLTNRRTIWIPKFHSDAEAAATLFHESHHTTQTGSDALKNEIETWIVEEKFRIKCMLAGSFKGSRKEGPLKGPEWKVNEAKIKKVVEDLYQEINPASPFIYEQLPIEKKNPRLISNWKCP